VIENLRLRLRPRHPRPRHPHPRHPHPRPPPLPLHPLYQGPIKRSRHVSFIIRYFYFFLFYLHLFIILQKEVFLWVDSELKEVYEIDCERTWADQKDEVVTKLLPPLHKIMNKKYDVSRSELLQMLHARWRSRHRVNNIKMKGDDRIKQEKRRAKKNSRMQDVSKHYYINIK
jgi:hypothetical protein